MKRNRTERSDEANSSFGLSEAALENIKPGSMRSDERDRITGADQRGSEEGHHRLLPREEKDIPQGSLAERIRKATKGS